MKRKLGIKKTTHPAGSGKIEGDESGKFVKGIAKQTDFAGRIKEVQVKFVPIVYLKTDPKNPRKLSFSSDVIKLIVKSHPCNELIQTSEDSFWIDKYVKEVALAYDFSDKTKSDFYKLVQFANNIKAADNLIQAVTAWRDESMFNLICGERRFLAHLLFEADTIQCKYLPETPSENAIRAMQWAENEERDDTTAYGRLVAVRQLVDSVGGETAVSVRGLSAMISRGKTQASRYLRLIRDGSPLLLQYLESGKIGDLTRADSLVELDDKALKALIEGDKPTTHAPSIRIARDANKDVVEKFLHKAAEAFGAKDVLKGLDLSKSKHANEAINRLFAYVAEQT